MDKTIEELAYKDFVRLVLLDVMDLQKLLEWGVISQRQYDANISRLRDKVLNGR
jgi:hypothetical protein